MELSEAIRQRRTVRVFKQEMIPDSELRELIDAGRMASCGGNLQRLRYMVVRDKELVNKIFALTAWAGFVQPRRNPVPGETAPVAFIVLYAKKGANMPVADAGAAIENLQLAAWEKGIGCCWIGAYKKEEADKLLELNDDEQSVYLVALGYAAECPVSEDIDAGGDCRYYLDEANRLHVPKLTVEALTVWK